MQNFGSCDGLPGALEKRVQARLEQLQRGLRPESSGPDRDPDRIAEDFASVLYTQVVKQMQKAGKGEDEEQSPLAGGVHDFLGMLLPQAISRTAGDPVATYIERIISGRVGGDDASES